MPGSVTAMNGKVCLVTGATSGIGRVAAQALAAQGATVAIVGRDRGRCETTQAAIRAATGNSAVYSLLADLSSQQQIRQLAAEVVERFPRLDLLLNNAGAMFFDRRESADGIEMTFALNHLAYFLLTNLLLERLRSSAPSRIVNVASDAHTWARRLDFEDLQGRRRYGGFRAYARSKLANLLFTYELARRLEGTGVTVNALHPGFVSTNIFAGNGAAGAIMRLGATLLAIGPEKGAETSIYLGTSPDVEGVSGAYYYRKKPAASSRASHDEEAARQLWGVSLELTGVTSPAD